MSSSPIDSVSDRHRAALDFLYSRENYERWRTMPYDAARMGLERMRRLMEELGSPERDIPVVHIAGTKGKGSSAAMIAAVLQRAGYRTGLFTSPHLVRIEERIQIDGQPCLAEFDELVDIVRPVVEWLDQEKGDQEKGNSPIFAGTKIGTVPAPTFFEIITAMAFVHFARQKVGAAVMEVGLGGRLDSTNVCRPVVSIITSISFDHMQQLGNTLAAIAGEKAGIIRAGVPVVSGVVEPEPRDVIRAVCRERGAPLVELGTDFDFTYEPTRHLEREAARGRIIFHEAGKKGRTGEREKGSPIVSPSPFLPFSLSSVPLSLPGRHQATNAAVAIAAIEILRDAGWKVTEEAVRAAIVNTTWPARVEVVARRPAVVLDAAHNAASVAALAETLRESFSVARRLLIFGTTHDKDARAMLDILLREFDEVYFTLYRGARAVDPLELQRLGEELTGRKWPIFTDSAAAWAAARGAAGEEDLICITGSFFLAAEMGERFGGAGKP